MKTHAELIIEVARLAEENALLRRSLDVLSKALEQTEADYKQDMAEKDRTEREDMDARDTWAAQQETRS